jgi:uncharacterized membrane protein YeiB
VTSSRTAAWSRAITGPRILVGLLAAAATVHVVLAVRLWDSSRIAILDLLLAVAAMAVLVVVLRTAAAQAALLAAAVVGAVGVASYLLPTLLAAAGGRSLAGLFDGWSFAALLVDALVVRVAVLALRRSESP